MRDRPFFFGRGRRVSKKLFIAAIIFIQCGAAAYGEKEIYQTLNLEEAVNVALEKNFRIGSTQRSLALAEDEEKAASSEFFPSLEFNGVYTRLSEEPVIDIPARSIDSLPTRDDTLSIGDRDTYDYRLTLEQIIFAGGEKTYRYKSAQTKRMMAELLLEREKMDIALEAKKRYFEVLKAQRMKEMTFFAIKVLEDHERVAKELFSTGMIPKNELLKSQVALVDTKHDDVRADNALSLSKLSLKKFLGLDENVNLHIVDIVDYRPMTVDLATSIRQALENRPEIKLRKTNARLSDIERKLAKSEYFPEIKLFGNVGRQRGMIGIEDYYWNIGIDMTWEIWDGFGTRYKVSQAGTRKDEALKKLDEITREIKIEVERAVLNVIEAQKRIKAMQETIAQAGENLRINEERYKEKVATTTDVLDALAMLVQVRIKKYNAIYDFHISKSELKRAVSGAALP